MKKYFYSLILILSSMYLFNFISVDTKNQISKYILNNFGTYDQIKRFAIALKVEDESNSHKLLTKSDRKNLKLIIELDKQTKNYSKKDKPKNQKQLNNSEDLTKRAREMLKSITQNCKLSLPEIKNLHKKAIEYKNKLIKIDDKNSK